MLDESGRNDELLADLEVATVLQTWDSIKGYPVVNIERDYTSGSLTITQVQSKPFVQLSISKTFLL